MCPTGSSLPTRQAACAGFRQAFDVLDADRDGKISGDDLRAFYSGLSEGSDGREREEIISSMISVADSNRDGFVQYDEFKRVLGYGKKRSGGRDGGSGVMEDVFKLMDTDGDGRLSYGDLKSYMRRAGFEASDDDIKAMIKLGGGDDSEGVSFDGLLKILAVDRLG